MKSKASQQKRFLRIITVPVRALSRARDFYVRSMSDYADKMNYGNAMPIPVTSQVTTLPRSFSVASARPHDNQDLDLARAASTRGMGDRVDLDSYIKEQMQMKMKASPAPGPTPTAMPPRSTSVAMGRIDEDSPCCYFGEDCEIKFPRSRSHAVSSARRLPAF